MSIKLPRAIQCDHPDCDTWWRVNAEESSTEARARAALHSWKSYQVDEAMQDICPIHAQEVSGR